MFLAPDEHMIVMNTNDASSGGPYIHLTTQDLIRLREECGIKVVHDYIYWSSVENNKSYDWRLADSIVKRSLDAGMRVVLFSPISVPQGLPEEMYARSMNGKAHRGILSFWNMAAREYQRNWLKTLIGRYGSDDVTVAYVGFIGECYLWNSPVYLDQAACDDFRSKYGSDVKTHAANSTPSGQLLEWISAGVVDHCLAMQEVVVGQHNEVWDTTQSGIAAQSHHNGVFARPAVMAAYKEHFPDADRFLLQYTYWAHGPGQAVEVDDLLEEHDFWMIVEAEYCRGLKDIDYNTATEAIKGGYYHRNPERWRGMVVCPLHPFGGAYKTLEPWMMDAMKRAVDTWKGR